MRDPLTLPTIRSHRRAHTPAARTPVHPHTHFELSENEAIAYLPDGGY